jgi:hypothetical protein
MACRCRRQFLRGIHSTKWACVFGGHRGT